MTTVEMGQSREIGDLEVTVVMKRARTKETMPRTHAHLNNALDIIEKALEGFKPERFVDCDICGHETNNWTNVHPENIKDNDDYLKCWTDGRVKHVCPGCGKGKIRYLNMYGGILVAFYEESDD